MKIIVIAGVLLCAATCLHAAQIVPKAGLDLPGSFSLSQGDISIKGDVGEGYSAGLEIFGFVSPQVAMGGGVEYQSRRKITTFGGSSLLNEPEFSFVPVYGALKIFLSRTEAAILPFVKLHAGYNMLFEGNDAFKGPDTLKGGLYWAIGGGLEIARFLSLELLYASYKGTASFAGLSVDNAYSRVGLSLGFVFNL